MIPISTEVQQLIGDWAEGVENRSLVHEKFALTKVWGHPKKVDDANRWSVLRIVKRGESLLTDDANRLANDARKRRGRANEEPNPHRRDELLQRAEESERLAGIAGNMAKAAKKLANTAVREARLAEACERNSASILKDLDRSFKGMVATFEATLGARMMVNLAGGVVENAGIALDRCFGLPLIPGSAVKGITRVQALWEIHEAKGDEKRRLLRLAMLLLGYGAHDIADKGDFGWAGGTGLAKSVAGEIGAQEFKGCACFLPAYPTTPPTLVVDMVNPHYPEYYGGRKQEAKDNENPIPNYFPAVESGCSFGFAVLLNRVPSPPNVIAADLLTQVKGWLERAVTRKGVGAKTAAGYGWFELGRKTTPVQAATAQTTSPAAAPASPADALINKWRGKLATNGNFPAALPELLELADDAELRRAFEAVIPEAERRKNRKGNPYWQSFTSGRHGEIGKKILARLKFNLT